MTDDILKALPARNGHFLLESGYHTDLWLTQDALFVAPRELAPLITLLAGQLAPHGASAVCGPLLGGAFLAQLLAAALGVDFFFTERVTTPSSQELFTAQYCLPDRVQRRIGGHRVAVVDDVISAGSAVRATVRAVAATGASTVAVGTLLVLGTAAVDHFKRLGVPVEALGQREFRLWQPAECPLCRAGTPLEDPTRAGPTASEI